MIKQLSYDLLKKCLDGIGIRTVPDEDGTLLTLFRADERYRHDLVIRYIVRGPWLHIVGQVPGEKIPEERFADMMMALNLLHINGLKATGALHDDSFRFKYSLMIDEEVSEGHVLESGARTGTESIQNAFVELEKLIEDYERNHKRYALAVIG
jgi:hypothetical protein